MEKQANCGVFIREIITRFPIITYRNSLQLQGCVICKDIISTKQRKVNKSTHIRADWPCRAIWLFWQQLLFLSSVFHAQQQPRSGTNRGELAPMSNFLNLWWRLELKNGAFLHTIFLQIEQFSLTNVLLFNSNFNKMWRFFKYWRINWRFLGKIGALQIKITGNIAAAAAAAANSV